MFHAKPEALIEMQPRQKPLRVRHRSSLQKVGLEGQVVFKGAKRAGEVRPDGVMHLCGLGGRETAVIG